MGLFQDSESTEAPPNKARGWITLCCGTVGFLLIALVIFLSVDHLIFLRQKSGSSTRHDCDVTSRMFGRMAF